MGVNQDYDVREYEVQRTFILSVGNKFHISPSQGFDFGDGLVEIDYVGPCTTTIQDTEDFRVLSDGDPDIVNEVWIGLHYIPGRNKDIDRYYGNDIFYYPAELLAIHLSTQ